MQKCLIYNHPSVAPPNIQLGRWYTLDELRNVYGFSLEYITHFFMPTNFGFEELEEIYPKKKEEKKKDKKDNKE